MRSVLLFAWLVSSVVLLLKGRAWLVRRAAAAAGLRFSGLPMHAPALLRFFSRRLRSFFVVNRNGKQPERPSHLAAVLQRASAAGGDYGVLLGDRAVVHCTTPALARAALAAAGPSKAPLYAAFTGFVGTALFTAEGEAWRAERTAVTKALAAPSIASVEAVARTAAATAVEAILRDAARSVAAGGNGVINLMPHFQRLTLRATVALLSGGGCPAPSDSEADAYLSSAAALRACLPAKARDFWFNVLPAWAHARLTPAGRAEARAVRSAHLLAERCVRHAVPGSPLWLLLGTDACGGGEDRAAVSSGDRNSPGSPSENGVNSGVQSPFRVPIDAVRRAQTLLFAGHDTQAATLCWAAVRMGLEEDGGVGVQARLRAACAASSSASSSASSASSVAAAAAVTAATARGACCCGRAAVAAHTPAALCSNVPCNPPPFPSLLEAVLKETLRLHPPAPLVLRPLRHAFPIPVPLPGEEASSVGAKPFQITIPKQRAQSPPSRRRHAPAGAAAAVWLHAAQRDCSAWAPDPHSFRPDRWLQQPSASPPTPPAANSALNSGGKKSADGEAFGVSCSDAQRLAYLPFAAGARACPGGAVALASLRPALAEIVARVKWECCDKHGGDFVPGGEEQEGGVLRPSDGFTVTPMHGVWARVRPA